MPTTSLRSRSSRSTWLRRTSLEHGTKSSHQRLRPSSARSCCTSCCDCAEARRVQRFRSSSVDDVDTAHPDSERVRAPTHPRTITDWYDIQVPPARGRSTTPSQRPRNPSAFGVGRRDRSIQPLHDRLLGLAPPVAPEASMAARVASHSEQALQQQALGLGTSRSHILARVRN